MKKALVNLSRIIVGVLFIISGFVKLVDPLGFSYKLDEYFGVEVLNLPFLQPFALWLSIFLVVFELLLGVMLLLGYAKKFTTWSLLLMIVFFSFLTFYSAYFNKVTDCGCFGDAMPLTPWQSFTKDIILLVLILIIFVNRKLLTPWFGKPPAHKWIVFVAFIGCLSLGYYALMHLPPLDFRAYKEGTNIKEGMTSHDGEIAPIHDFAFYSQDGDDETDIVLNEPKVLMVVSYNIQGSEKEGWTKIHDAIEKARKNGYKIIGMSSSGPADIAMLKDTYGIDAKFYYTDETAIKTIIRSNPGLVVIKKGIITQKLHWNDAEELNVN